MQVTSERMCRETHSLSLSLECIKRTERKKQSNFSLPLTAGFWPSAVSSSRPEFRAERVTRSSIDFLFFRGERKGKEKSSLNFSLLGKTKEVKEEESGKRITHLTVVNQVDR